MVVDRRPNGTSPAKESPQSNDNPRRPVNGTGFVSQETYPGPPVSTTASCAKPDRPNPQSQSLSRSYGSNLPTSLTYIILSTRGCSPWRPAADMGTSWCEFAVTPLRFSRSHRPLVDATKSATLFAKKPKPILSSKEFQGLGGLCRKDNSSQSFGGRLSVCSCCHD